MEAGVGKKRFRVAMSATTIARFTREGGLARCASHSDDQRTRHEVPEIPWRVFRSMVPSSLHLHEACCDDQVDDQADEQR